MHLFCWTWRDILKEIPFLKRKGYGAIQISPPNEHRIVRGGVWYERYQPVSYRLESRSGTEKELRQMVAACQEAGIKVYADAVINHMSGPTAGEETGFAGSKFSHYTYSDLGLVDGSSYTHDDFNHAGSITPEDFSCGTDRVRSGELVGLADLRTDSPRVREIIGKYLARLLDIGVAGFRIDAGKHMRPEDIDAILKITAEQAHTSNFDVFIEVIEDNCIHGSEYYDIGQVTEFQFMQNICRHFQNSYFPNLLKLHEDWQELLPSRKSVVFIDNHDEQRKPAHELCCLTHRDYRLYDLACIFMLGWDYGRPKIMSSYKFTDQESLPPMFPAGTIAAVHTAEEPSTLTSDAFSNWIMEHRWSAIANMVALRACLDSTTPVCNRWQGDGRQIAWSRSGQAYIIINLEESRSIDKWLKTGLPEGNYNNLCHGAWNDSSQGTVSINKEGWGRFNIPPFSAAAICTGSKA